MLHAVLLAATATVCGNAQTQTDLNICWTRQAHQADIALNATYARVSRGLKKLGIDPSVLEPVQRAWTSARDSTCSFEASLFAGGTMMPMQEAMCFDRMAHARASRLNGLLETLRAEGVIQTAAPVSRKVDAELNRVYRLLAKQLTPAQRKLLTASEIAWMAYRDKACKVEGYTCFDVLETERTAELKAGWMGDPFW